MKPLPGKAYGHIPHLPGSRVGPSDHHVNPGQARICLEQTRDKHDEIIVQEKLDGSCVAVLRLRDRLVPVNRAGHYAASAPWPQHHLFAKWAMQPAQHERFARMLREGERLVGEWLAQAHGTRYALSHEPFVAFDLMLSDERLGFDDFLIRLGGHFTLPRLIHRGGALGLASLQAKLEPSGHGALDPVEGAVYRVERAGRVDFLAKYVRPDKVDGLYLPEVSGNEAIWNWRLREEAA